MEAYLRKIKKNSDVFFMLGFHSISNKQKRKQKCSQIPKSEVPNVALIYSITSINQGLIGKNFVGGAKKENFTPFCFLGGFKNSLRCLYGLECLSSCKSDFRCFILWIPLHKFNQSTKKRATGKNWTGDKDCVDSKIGRWKEIKKKLHLI